MLKSQIIAFIYLCFFLFTLFVSNDRNTVSTKRASSTELLGTPNILLSSCKCRDPLGHSLMKTMHSSWIRAVSISSLRLSSWPMVVDCLADLSGYRPLLHLFARSDSLSSRRICTARFSSAFLTSWSHDLHSPWWSPNLSKLEQMHLS